MGGINDYLNAIKKQYPDTKEVNDQIEELRDTLHLKTEEYQAMGKTYSEAVAEAIASMGDLTPLLDQVSGNTRSVYVSRPKRDNALYSMLMMAAQYLLGWLFFLLFCQDPGIYFLPYFVVFLFILGMALAVWPIAAHIQCKRQPDKVETPTMPYRKNMRIALIAWGCISAFLILVNAVTWHYNYALWAVWPTVGIANWPLNVWLHHRLLTSGKYDAE